MEPDKVPALAAEIEALLAERLHIRGRNPSDSLRKAHRLLPRRLRREALTLSRADALSAHPKLRRQIDRAAVERAHAALARHLRGIDPAARRRAKILDLLAFAALAILLTGAGLVAWMRWRGLV